MSNVDFRTLLAGDLEDIPDVIPLPEGQYLGRITTIEFGTTKDKEAPYVRFNLMLESPEEGVNMDEFNAATAVVPLADVPLRSDFFLHTPKAKQRVRDFLHSCGQKGNFEKSIAQMQGARVKVQVVHTPTKDGKDKYVNAGNLVGIE